MTKSTVFNIVIVKIMTIHAQLLKDALRENLHSREVVGVPHVPAGLQGFLPAQLLLQQHHVLSGTEER